MESITACTIMSLKQGKLNFEPTNHKINICAGFNWSNGLTNRILKGSFTSASMNSLDESKHFESTLGESYHFLIRVFFYEKHLADNLVSY